MDETSTKPEPKKSTTRKAAASPRKAVARGATAAPGGNPGDPIVPEGFLFGVATAGFQVEGGFNGPGEPANNWANWEAAGRVEPSGIAIDFWNRYEDQLDLVASMGCNSFRMSVEWARVEPAEGEIDDKALARYAAILDACRGRGLEPLVTLAHFTHPEWLGVDFWLRPDAPDRFASWTELVLDRLGDRCRHWVTLNEVNILASGSFLIGQFPPGRVGAVGDAFEAFENLLSAHVAAYEAIHRSQPDAVVGTNTASTSLYELDRMLTDLLLFRGRGVARRDLIPWLAARRHEWYQELAPPGIKERALRGATARPAMRRLGASVRRSGSSRGLLDRIEESEHERLIDVVQIDYYDPLVSRHLRMPGHHTAGGRSWSPARRLWDDVVNPGGLITYLRANASDGLDVWIAENGLCNRVRNGRSYDRLDGWDRARYLRENLAAVVAARDAGIPVAAYFHWTLADNYEWGSYEPRFGLFGVDRARRARVSNLDSMGGDAAGAYREIIAGLRSGDRSVLR
ncbi:MAG: family 1 glycosylhydrolase [Actinomycetota bacterium]|nr:family 1 glycosylhydrolase [Actinomycetota bacterium]